MMTIQIPMIRSKIFICCCVIPGLSFFVLACSPTPTAPSATSAPPASPPPLATPTRSLPTATVLVPMLPSSTATATAIPLAQLMVKGGDYFFDAPDQIEAGLVRVVFQNTGTRNHNLKIWRLKPGKTITDVKGVEDLNAVFLTADTFYGGLNSTSPGSSKAVVLDLIDGDYVLVSAPPLSNSKDHDIAKGMAKALKVAARLGPQPIEPRADQTLVLKDDTIVLPPTIPSGENSILVLNQGTQAHQIIFLRLSPGKTLVDFKSAFTTGNLFQAADPAFGSPGSAEFSPGKRVWLAVDFPPGNYVAWDDLAGLKNGPIAFTVTAR